MQPRYTPPSRKTKYLPQMYEAEVSCIRTLTRAAKCFSLTTDLWTFRANHAYTGVNVYFITNKFDLHHYLLDRKEFPESPTSVNIANELQSILQDWEIDEDRIAVITTDNGMNITSTVRILDWIRVPCFSHTLQLKCEQSLEATTSCMSRVA